MELEFRRWHKQHLQNPTHAYTNAATFFPTLTCVNNNGSTVIGSGPAIMTSPPPPIQFTAYPTNGLSRLTVQFNSPAGDAGGNAILHWNWNFGDGSSGTAQYPSHTYTNGGTYFPSLTCTNNNGDTIAGFGPAITTYPPLPIQFTANPTNGFSPPATIQFNAPAVDAGGKTILHWNWNFGDGSNGTAQNPSHTYTNSGTYFPNLTCTNKNGDTIASYGPAIVVPSTILLNGGFETGTFTNWTLSGFTTSSQVGADSPYTPFTHSGKYGAGLVTGTSKTAQGFLSQSLATTPGASYLISFWLHRSVNSRPNDFQVSWNGNILLDETNLGNIGWTNIQLTVTATATTSTLQFGFLTATYNFGLDDVIVMPMPQADLVNISLSGTNLVLDGINGVSGSTNYLLMSTNLTQPFSQWTRVATNVLGTNGNFSLMAPNGVSPNTPQRFYILWLP